MLFDVRTYTLHPGTLSKQLDLYQRYGFAAQTRHLGKPFAFLVPETGNINSFTHIWCYQDAGDREHRRAAMKADPEWQHYLKITADAGYYLHQENRLMNNAPFMD
ncbi:NIPSNAP family protein [Aestuariirhabdus sp. Z084]|uniref:NIPSNAP family protein n=1 Tax=Aestuariirhabdus haliotis TaxID=2918751 RepID=UPI00201B3D71|nr:NIPSNAP family protein [Aestuariirhabdus haliotis]MCL6415101.1 NIPSNAP family protein [Aestuariirhabdus haliotis]MCL6419033.1 NIPSNAP family protein [Aestuariirhabdus haliotis]